MSEKTIKKIKENYKRIEKSIVEQLFLEFPDHHSTTGSYREDVWQALFRQIVPYKFAIAKSVFIIDSNGKISKEVDLAIFDEQYTPYIFNYGNVRFIPIEAVAVVIQCKSTNFEKIKEWIQSIDILQTSSESIARLATNISFGPPLTQKATRPIRILCALKKYNDNKELPKFEFDISIYAKKNSDKLNCSYSDKLSDLYHAYRELNHSKINDKDDNLYAKFNGKKICDFEVTGNSILSLVFQLNQLLMLINNPMLFPHQAYVKMFNKYS